jgi:hypothetical protein
LFLVFLFLLFSFFLFISGRKAKIKMSRLECGGHSCLSTAVMAFSSTVFFDFSVPDLLNPVAFLKTHAPQPHSLTSSAPSAGSTSHAGRQSPARGLHTLESSLLFGVRDGHASLFSGHARWGWGLRWLIYGWVALVTAHVLHALPSPAVSAPASTAGSLIFVVSVCLCCVFSCFLLYSLLVYYSDFIEILVGLMLDWPSFI